MFGIFSQSGGNKAAREEGNKIADAWVTDKGRNGTITAEQRASMDRMSPAEYERVMEDLGYELQNDRYLGMHWVYVGE